ncbi:hypothetical protein IFM89_029303 [Coptis chinensis]|uniref:Pentatricopeptide repeat-containing protein n=1 Tax=Coptis chinensis TaxID=261450 RepID=A0A835HY40_9MAGN|nr:hypothetical protein IFM89_029303 [Coptis chinensis]
MVQVHKLEPNVKHYGCMVDLLGRAGLLKEAEELIESMPIPPDVATWGALLGACKKHGNTKMAERVGKKLIEVHVISSDVNSNNKFHTNYAYPSLEFRDVSSLENVFGRFYLTSPGFSPGKADAMSMEYYILHSVRTCTLADYHIGDLVIPGSAQLWRCNSSYRFN